MQKLKFILLIIIKNNVPKYNHHKTWLDVFFEFICNKIQKNHDKAIKIILLLYVTIKSFDLDVLFFNKIYYSYKAIIKLCLPLFIEYCVYSINTSIQVKLTSLDVICIYDLKDYIFKRRICKTKTTLSNGSKKDILSYVNLAFSSKICIELFKEKNTNKVIF